MKNEFIIDTLNSIEGYKTRLKEIHWSSPNMCIHELSDEFSTILGNYEDQIAELAISLWGEIVPGELEPISSGDMDFLSLLQTILGKAIEVKRNCESGLMWTGIESVTDSFIADVQTYIFKVRMEYKSLKN